MIMGDTCTRACAFCNVATGIPKNLDHVEPARVGDAVARLGLNHVVVTSVDRDDLADGGAKHFAHTIAAIRTSAPDTTIEVLTPDFMQKEGAAEVVAAAKPDVFNHNIETVPRLYPTIRPGSRYFTSLQLLHEIKRLNPAIFTKSGMMAGLGESRDEIHQVMDDLRAAEVDFLTIGQYLQPTPKHAAIERFVPPDEFEGLARMARGKGFDGLSVTIDAIFLSRRRRFPAPRAAREGKSPPPNNPLRDCPPLRTFSETKHLPFAAHDLYEIVVDVDRYDEFLPWCGVEGPRTSRRRYPDR